MVFPCSKSGGFGGILFEGSENWLFIVEREFKIGGYKVETSFSLSSSFFSNSSIRGIFTQISNFLLHDEVLRFYILRG